MQKKAADRFENCFSRLTNKTTDGTISLAVSANADVAELAYAYDSGSYSRK